VDNRLAYLAKAGEEVMEKPLIDRARAIVRNDPPCLTAPHLLRQVISDLITALESAQEAALNNASIAEALAAELEYRRSDSERECF
jgi:hypothetical protein